MNNQSYITLSQLQERIGRALAGEFAAPVWVVAEIGEIKVNHSSGHCYLELVEKGGTNAVPRARASAVIWRQRYGVIASYFAGATGRELAAGMKVMLGVGVSYHELYGLSLVVNDIDPLYTLGDLEQQRLLTIERLKEDGTFDLNRELGMPLVPQRVAVVSSPGAAGFQDFMNELGASDYRFDVELFDATMQGHGAEGSIIDALGAIAVRESDFDVVVVIRGGGSQSDLGFLNSYLLCSHIAQFPLPVVAGLGHDKDRSVVDMVAARSLKTPTAAAGYLVQCVAEFEAAVEAAWAKIAEKALAVTASQDERLRRHATLLAQTAAALTHSVERRLVSMEALVAERARGALSRATRRLAHIEDVVVGCDPARILARGFAIVRQHGRALTSAAEADSAAALDITLHKGTITANITEHGRE